MFTSNQPTVGCREIDRESEEGLRPTVPAGDSESTEEGPPNSMGIPTARIPRVSENVQSSVVAVQYDSEYWLAMVERLGYDQAVYCGDAAPNLESLLRYFDCTATGMLRVFDMFDQDHDSEMSPSEVARGLRQQALYTKHSAESDQAFHELCGILASRSPRGTLAGNPEERIIKPPEFMAALKCLRMAALLHAPEQAKQIRIHIYEYREDFLYSRNPLEDPVSFLFRPTAMSRLLNTKKIQKPFRVRWLHSHDPSQAAVLGLAIKYGLDPRFVLDVFTLWREGAKVDHIFGYRPTGRGDARITRKNPPLWSIIIIPVLRLTQTSRNTLRPWQSWRRQKLRKDLPKVDKTVEPPIVKVEVEQCNLAMFVTGKAEGGTLISFSSEWVTLCKTGTDRDDEESKAGNGKGKKHWWSRKTQSQVTVDDERAESTADTRTWTRFRTLTHTITDWETMSYDMSIFRNALGNLKTSYSNVRTGDTHTLLFKILCDITEDYILVGQAYDASLSVLQRRLDREMGKFYQKDVKRLRKIVRQLGQLYRMSRPVLDVLETAVGYRHWSPDSQMYTSDIRSNTHRFLEESLALRENARMMLEQYRQYCESKTSNILYVLTLVTTTFVPGQFLTGVYGMNFQNPITGDPGMPELLWEHGYLYFWLLLLTITSLIFFLYRKQKWI
ncbi:methylated-DNA--protein-cysteine methyltransferase [Perkinsus olseni]|uniref:Methylated-DNA--protein-cysteine methyltransferase n=1 Tax=Perkinsus olseni TaxID=32597 RepID=A0A7J6L046_PEROL|nr:methylated-DNA--protein-cysteine methyltransferase [Perkinsus olseni]